MKSRPNHRRTAATWLGMAGGIAVGLLMQVLPTVAQDLVVKYDQSQLLRLPRPVSEIIIGNPTIADVTVQAPNLLVVTGKTFGITNVISLDAERNVIMDQRVVVVREAAQVVSLQKGSKRESYNCTPICNPSAIIGDDQAYFESVVRNGERKMKFSEKSAESSGAPGSQ
ncbi:MAG: pilus assembly protein N-terminal domain-containing protein [Hyphomicrobiaceae bacterium]